MQDFIFEHFSSLQMNRIFVLVDKFYVVNFINAQSD